MPKVAVAGSENAVQFAVVDFTHSPPGLLLPNPGFNAGCRVDVDQNMAAVGSVLDGKVTVYDISVPSAPVKGATIDTLLQGIGAIAIKGSLVAVGEFVNNFQARVTLIDFSSPQAPQIKGTAATPFVGVNIPPDPDDPNSMNQVSGAISSLAFSSPFIVVASSPNDFRIAQINFTNMAVPTVTMISPTLSGAPTIDADADANTLAAGDNNGTFVKLFNATTQALLGSQNTQLGGVGSVSVKGQKVFAGSPNDFRVAFIDFPGSSVVRFDPMMGGGSTVALEVGDGVCGAILGTIIKLFNLSVSPPTLIASMDTTLPSISTIKVTTFTLPAVMFMPSILAFGAVRKGTSKVLPLTITNSGGMLLTVSNLQSTDARFTFAPAGPFSIPPGMSVTLSVTFAPTAEASFSGSLKMTTNDLANPSPSIPLSGVGALPHIKVLPTSLNAGNVPVCLLGTVPFTIQDTGGLTLTVFSMTTSGAPFTVSAGSATVPPGGMLSFTVTFKPISTGAASGTLTIISDDPNTPTLTIPLTGTGLPTPPAAISVSPASLTFGAVPVQFFVGLRITIANTGPCQALNFTMTSSGGPFFVTASDPTTLPPSATSLTDTLLAGSSRRYVVVFAPTATGTIAGTLTITSNDPANPNVSIPLSGNGVQQNPLALEFVLDRSGSMSGAAPGGTKMDALKAAVALFADIVLPDQGNEMGSVQFDDQFSVLTPFASYTAAQQTQIETDAQTLSPRGMTSIGGGLQTAQAQVTPSALGRKAVVVFTDGMENTPPMIASVEPGMLAAGLEIYAVGLGQPQNISSAALALLAASANGKFFQTDDTLILRKDFVQVLADAYRNNMAADPIFSLQSGQTVDTPVQITRCEKRITFILNWDDPQSQITFLVQAPDGTLFTPNSPNTNRLVRYGQKPGYAFYQIAFPPVDPGSGSGLAIGPLQVGTWLLRAVGTSLNAATERCAANVIVDSDLTIDAVAQAPNIISPIQLSVGINDQGRPVVHADVTCVLTVPLRSLAAVMTPQVIHAALDADQHPIPAGSKPLIRTRTLRFPALFDKDRRRFVANLPAPKVDGVYRFEIFASGKACGGTFQRYASFSQYIGRTPDKKNTVITVTPAGPFGVVVSVVPKDAQNKKLGPGLASLIQSTAKNVTVFPLADRGDGSYGFRVVWRGSGPKPQLQIKVGDIEKDVPLTELTKPRPILKAKKTKKTRKR